MEKCSFFQDSIKYLGQNIDKNGRRPDPKKIEAVVKMPPPTNVPTLRSYLGMVNFYQPYVSDLRKSLSVLLKAVDLALKCIRDHKLEKRFEVEMRHVTITAACTVLCERGFERCLRDAAEIQKLKVKEMMEIRSELAVEKTQTVADKTRILLLLLVLLRLSWKSMRSWDVTKNVVDTSKNLASAIYAAKRDGASLSGDEFKRFKAAGSKE
uniref:Uncharacterized protein n=1 Tax=Ditylenchus dipsaci TaxID=166011 RepID=A0A915CPA7_9BILA